MSTERYSGDTAEKIEGMPDEGLVNADMSPVTAEEMATELEQMKAAAKESEQKTETMHSEEPASDETPGISPEDILLRQEKDKEKIEALKEELKRSSEQPTESGDGGGNDNERPNEGDPGDDGKKRFKMTHESHTTYKPCEACGGSGRRWFIFNCPACNGSGSIKASEASKTQIDRTQGSQSPETGLDENQQN